ncbi:PIN domain-containing protein [Winogradskyella sp. UBA3174]|uniref:PIN domain-containing protein n=1 Tax=Winogradskyella sp. UBA3174 TaxID=1947785 RepID=UPI0025ED9C9D|nr:PIN domain-containing protein [Winogradskyella sp. UBA3174]|tara:strand:+ start:544 stop:2046 length:1503 start_codon:yes stop_codon:yes gene_type:complete
MRILIDTNIIIHREANRVFNEDIGLLFNWLDKLKFNKCVHPLSIEEISGYQDEEVVKTMKIKIANYNLLKTESADDQLITQIRQSDKSHNDFIDTSILNEVYNNRVDYLITEDRGIHRKANYLGCSEKVFKIDAFLEKCIAENPELKNYQVLAVKKEYFGNINIDDTFFDSFKQDYDEFGNWFNKKADNISYVCITDGDVKAFLYLKQENTDEIYNDIEPSFSQKKRLKIGTFKVTSTGYKLGERFIKVIFDNALQYDVEEIYVTIFDKRDEQLRLIYLLEDWGFKHWGTKTTDNGIEQVFVRQCRPTPNLKQPKLSFPAVSKSTTKWIVPIYPEYHTELFPDSILNNESPQDFTENEPYRNAIKKVYISRSYNRGLNGGDLVLFYRTGGHYAGVISTIGVVENIVTDIRDESHFIELCRKRSVFDDKELKKYWNWNKNNRPFIVNFLYIDSFPMPKVNLKKLRDLNIIQNAPRGFEPISDVKFEQILKQARANESYIID